ncbi:MAG: hypothetical protein JXJ19_01165 [Elusimicrobia bacterium]|nr:hypothetical protein [Elusimicrobiota bacterium]
MDFEDIFRLISDYIDRELEADICSEMEEFFCMHEECRCFLDSFSETVRLCNSIQDMDVPEDVHVRLYKSLKITIRKNIE